METLLHFINSLINPISQLINLRINKKRNKTERIVELIKTSKELNNDFMNDFLSKEFFKKVSAEINDVELTYNQVVVVDKVLKDSNGILNWSDISNAQQYLIVSDTELKMSYSKSDKVFHYIFFCF